MPINAEQISYLSNVFKYEFRYIERPGAIYLDAIVLGLIDSKPVIMYPTIMRVDDYEDAAKRDSFERETAEILLNDFYERLDEYKNLPSRLADVLIQVRLRDMYDTPQDQRNYFWAIFDAIEFSNLLSLLKMHKTTLNRYSLEYDQLIVMIDTIQRTYEEMRWHIKETQTIPPYCETGTLLEAMIEFSNRVTRNELFERIMRQYDDQESSDNCNWVNILNGFKKAADELETE